MWWKLPSGRDGRIRQASHKSAAGFGPWHRIHPVRRGAVAFARTGEDACATGGRASRKSAAGPASGPRWGSRFGPRTAVPARSARSRNHGPDPGNRGFTLLEVIVALALASALMLILVIGMRLSASALEAGDRRLTKLDRSLAIVDVVSQQVAGAVPRIVMVKRDTGQVPTLCFSGNAREVRFLTDVSLGHDMAHGLWLADYRVVEMTDGQEQLLTSETPVLDSDHLQAALVGGAAPAGTTLTQPAGPGRSGDPVPPAPAGTVESLGDPAKRIELSYMAPATPDKPSGWVAEWNREKQTALPMGIRIQVWRSAYAGALTFAIPVREVEPK